MSKETAPLQPKPLIFIDEASAIYAGRPGLVEFLQFPHYSVHITSSDVKATQRDLTALIPGELPPNLVLPVEKVAVKDNLKTATEYRPAIDQLLLLNKRIKRNWENRLKFWQKVPDSQTPWSGLLILGEHAARPIDTAESLFMREDLHCPPRFNVIHSVIQFLWSRDPDQENPSVLRGWERLAWGEQFLKRWGNTLNKYEQETRIAHRTIKTPTLYVGGPNLRLVCSADLSTRTPEPTPA